MRKILLFIVFISMYFLGQSQYAPTSAKTRFVNGIGLSTKDTASLSNVGDTLAMIVGKDSLVYFKYKGYWRPLAYNSNLGSYVKYTDTAAMLSPYYRTAQAIAALALKLNISDTAAMLSPYARAYAYVPYTGATTNVNLGSYGLTTNSSQFNSISAPSYSQGLMWYDNTQKALAYYNDITNNTLHIGQEVQLKVHNNTGSTIPIASPVYITGTTSGFIYPNIALAKADALSTSNVVGLTNQAIANGADGYVVTSGLINGLNTGIYTVGNTLYLSPYSAGQLMNTLPPTGYAVRIGVVSYINSSLGSIYVNQSLAGTVTSVATNTGSGITGGTITNSGTIAADTSILATRLRVQKGIDSLGSAVSGGYVPYTGATGAVNLGAYDLTVNSIKVGKGGGAVATNTAVGYLVGAVNTTGSANTSFGYLANAYNTTGSNNSAFGREALGSNVTQNNNSAFGNYTLSFLDIGINNTAFGAVGLTNLRTGSNNTALGASAGRFISGGVTSASNIDNSIFIGQNTKALADAQTNQIVIGYNETGLGSNTTILGNSSTVTTAVRGR
jgi:hypothetical protein